MTMLTHLCLPRSRSGRRPGQRKRSKIYGTGQVEVRALDRVSVEFMSGRFTAMGLVGETSPREARTGRMSMPALPRRGA
jgi:hypothetical protein